MIRLWKSRNMEDLIPVGKHCRGRDTDVTCDARWGLSAIQDATAWGDVTRSLGETYTGGFCDLGIFFPSFKVSENKNYFLKANALSNMKCWFMLKSLPFKNLILDEIISR